MSARRTVTVLTLDFGPVTVDEPEWCEGHGLDLPQFRVDVTHYGPETVLTVDTARGPVVIARAALESRPFTERPPGTDPFVNVELGGDYYPCRPTDLRRIADQLTTHGHRFRALADQLTAEASQ